MRIAAAVAAAETVDRFCIAPSCQRLCPSVLKASLPLAVPDRIKCCYLTQIVDMPMLRLHFPAMSRDPRQHTARPECTANVDIAAGSYVDGAPTSHLHNSTRIYLQHQAIGPGFCVHSNLPALFPVMRRNNKDRAFCRMKNSFRNTPHKQMIHGASPMRSYDNHIHIKPGGLVQNGFNR